MTKPREKKEADCLANSPFPFSIEFLLVFPFLFCYTENKKIEKSDKKLDLHRFSLQLHNIYVL